MAIDSARTMFGYAITCTGGTAAATASVVETRDKVIQITGILMTGAATTDIATVTDYDGNLIFRGVAANTSGNSQLMLSRPIRSQGLRVGIAGATTGWVTIFTD